MSTYITDPSESQREQGVLNGPGIITDGRGRAPVRGTLSQVYWRSLQSLCHWFYSEPHSCAHENVSMEIRSPFIMSCGYLGEASRANLPLIRSVARPRRLYVEHASQQLVKRPRTTRPNERSFGGIHARDCRMWHTWCSTAVPFRYTIRANYFMPCSRGHQILCFTASSSRWGIVFPNIFKDPDEICE